MNYNEKMKEIIKSLDFKKPKLLLHSCCAPCSSSVIEKTSNHFDITVLYYNPNIYPFEEYEIRKNEQKRFLESLNIPLIEGDYIDSEFYNAVLGYENCAEGGDRCYRCYLLRMRKTVEMAKEKGFDYFCTTLSVSPHKNSVYINQIGEQLEKEYGVRFLYSDFMNEYGYFRSIQISKERNFWGITVLP